MTNLLILLGLTPEIRSQYRDRLKARFPDVAMTLVDHHSKVGPHIAAADALLTFTPMMSAKVLENADRLRWIQTLGTGVDNLIDQPTLRKNVIVTNVRGIHGPPVSEAALGSMLALARNLPGAVRGQDAREWRRWPAKLLHNKTVGIFGVGLIAETLAPMCKAFGMRVAGVSSSPRAVAGFDRMHSRDALIEAVRDFDFFVLLTPLTPATRNVIDAKVLGAMKPSAFLINLARGGVVDESALVEALQEKRIAGAALDVFKEEPLPAAHPFWGMENVIITTHQGGFCDVYIDYALPTVETNMRAFLAGDLGAMINVVEH
ncbi:MAG TPA: D-2-hydroxyacid dehydrogenase [Xanthobacteraceae bacterium]|nr:D-2-hydroxyacid dehydrogenase [Xanthobacteraceae bacterium]